MAVTLDTNTSGQNLSVDDMLDFMGENDNPEEGKEKVVTDTEGVPAEKSEKKEEEKEEKEEEEKPEEIELKDDDEETVDIPARQAILKEFPELFKKFPALERAMYRERQYTELFPTVADAKDAQERLGDYDALESSLMNGDIGSVLKSVRETDDKAFAKITRGLLKQVAEVDQTAYFGIIDTVLKRAAITMYHAGAQAKNEDYQIAAKLFATYMFGTTDISLPQDDTQEKTDPEKQKLSEEREQFNKQKLDSAVEDVSNNVQNILGSNVDKYLDPKGVMSSYIKGKAKEDIIAKVDAAIESDTRFKAVLDKLWEKAIADGFSADSKNKIKTALLNKAKTVFPEILQSVRNNAIKGFGKSGKVVEEKEETPPTRKAERAQPKGDNKGIPRGMKSLDYLMQD